MKILIAEDDKASRNFLFRLLSSYGECDMTIDGIETVEAFTMAYDTGEPYDLLCLDIMMPKVDGLKALKAIREFENKKAVKEAVRCKVIITSALDEKEMVIDSSYLDYEVYLTKPIGMEKMKDALKKLSLID